MFKGSCAALVTPMKSNGEVDQKTLINLVEWHIEKGTQALVVCGSTGESATLSAQEQADVISWVVGAAKKRLPIIAGTGTNATQTTIERTRVAKELGVDACLVVAPYYNRPTQEGLLAHYRALNQAVDCPIILYNVPSRTGCDVLPETVAELSYLKNVIGIKEATGDLLRLERLKNQCAEDFLYFSGDDPTAHEFILRGGHGVISITANVAPSLMQKMCQAIFNKDFGSAQLFESKLAMLHRMLIAESNPIPVKWALHYLGKIGETLRLPLTSLSETYHSNIIEALLLAECERQ